MEIIGHQKQMRFLQELAKSEKLPHALLFTGEEKIGKKTVALEFIKSVFNNDNLESHPDFILVEPLENEIQIDQIKDLIWRLSLKPFSASLKFAVIDLAHKMNIQSQNCLLKTLEEPKGNTYLILITEHPELLVLTIRSRCETIKFYRVPEKEIKNYIRTKGISEKKVSLISQYSQGKPGMVIDFLNQPKKIKEKEKLVEDIIKLTKSDLAFRFQYAQKIAKSPELKEILNLWLLYFRQNLISQLEKDTGSTRAYSKDTGEKDTGSTRAYSEIIKKIQETYFFISTTNINPRLALENLMLQF